MTQHKPQVPFERYADDIVCHCKTEVEVNALKEALNERFNVCKLTLHPAKTHIIYCKDEDRRGNYGSFSFSVVRKNLNNQ